MTTELKSLSDRELWRRRSLAAIQGPQSVKFACDDEMRRRAAIKSAPDDREDELKGKLKAMPTSYIQQRRDLAIKGGSPGVLAILDAELRARGVAVKSVQLGAPRRQRKVLMPGPTCGSMTIVYVED